MVNRRQPLPRPTPPWKLENAPSWWGKPAVWVRNCTLNNRLQPRGWIFCRYRQILLAIKAAVRLGGAWWTRKAISKGTCSVTWISFGPNAQHGYRWRFVRKIAFKGQRLGVCGRPFFVARQGPPGTELWGTTSKSGNRAATAKAPDYRREYEAKVHGIPFFRAINISRGLGPAHCSLFGWPGLAIFVHPCAERELSVF